MYLLTAGRRIARIGRDWGVTGPPRWCRTHARGASADVVSLAVSPALDVIPRQDSRGVTAGSVVELARPPLLSKPPELTVVASASPRRDGTAGIRAADETSMGIAGAADCTVSSVTLRRRRTGYRGNRSDPADRSLRPSRRC